MSVRRQSQDVSCKINSAGKGGGVTQTYIADYRKLYWLLNRAPQRSVCSDLDQRSINRCYNADGGT